VKLSLAELSAVLRSLRESERRGNLSEAASSAQRKLRVVRDRTARRGAEGCAVDAGGEPS
jgi:hypothetical protein